MALTKEQILASEKKPAPSHVNVDGIPDYMKQKRHRWVVWKWVWDKKRGKWTKQPFAPGLTRPCDVAGARRRAWWSLEVCMAAYRGENLYHPDAQPDGIGYVIFEGDGDAGVDFDACRNSDTGELEQWAADAVAQFDTYTEVSPSGTGCKSIARATRSDESTKRHGHVEFYTRARFFCITGHRLPGTPPTVNARQVELDAIAAKFLPAPEPKKKPVSVGATPHYTHIAPIAEDAELLDRALRHPRFARLWNGDISSNDNDHSKADLSLCCSLAFWTHGDAGRMDRLFRASSLYRPKWDEHRGKRTYGEITIAKACRLTTSYWNPDAVTRMATTATATHTTPGVNNPADLLITIANLSVPEMVDRLWEEREPGVETPPALTRASCHICCGDHHATDCTANKPPVTKRHDPHRFYRPHAPKSQYCGMTKHFGCAFTGRGASPNLPCESRRKCERCQSHLNWQLWSLTDECIVLATLTASQEGREPMLYRWMVPTGTATRAIIKRIKRASGPNDGYRTIKQTGNLTWILSSAGAEGGEPLTETVARAELVTAIRNIPDDVKRPWDGSRTWAMPDETPTHECPACGGDIPRPPAASREMAPTGMMICDCPHCRRRVEVIPPMRELGITTQVDPAEPADARARRQLEAVGCIVEKTTTDPKSRNPVPILAWRLGPQYAGMEEVAMRGLELYFATCELPPDGDLTADMFGAEASLSDLLLPGLFSDRVNRTAEVNRLSRYSAHPPAN